MNKIISLALLIGGIALIIYGVSAADSIGGRFTRFFTGSPTDETVWMLLGGIVATVVGAGGILRGSNAS
jgi:hypothetical protein